MSSQCLGSLGVHELAGGVAPSTGRATPMMGWRRGCRARGLRRRLVGAAEAAHRVGWRRLRGSSSPLSIMSLTIGVSMVPGQMALTPDAAGCVLEGGAPGEADDAVLGGVVGGSAGQSDQAAEGGAVDDRAAALAAHVAQFVLHASPHAA